MEGCQMIIKQFEYSNQTENYRYIRQFEVDEEYGNKIILANKKQGDVKFFKFETESDNGKTETIFSYNMHLFEI